MPAAALDGVKVLDLTHHITGPYCTKLLADFGAEVIKIERPGTGDPARRMGPFASDEQHPDKSLPFLYLNTSKHSVTLDLKSDAGKDIIVKLAAQSDILVENFRPGAMASLGLDYESLSQSNPALVMVSISNFGQTGPYRDYEATEIVEYALGGLGYVFGSNLREPLKHALHQAQFKAGVNAAGAASIALYHQRLTGQGQWVDVSVQECVAAGLRDTISLYTYTGGIRGRQPAHSAEIPRTPFQTRDGHIVPVTLGAMDWETIADFVGRPELKEPRFSTPAGRQENATELNAIVTEAFAQREKFEIFETSHQRRGFVYGVVQSPADVVSNPQYRHRGFFADIEHPVAGKAIYPGAPFKMSRTPWKARSAAPTLGRHNQEVLGDRLGLTPPEIQELQETGVV